MRDYLEKTQGMSLEQIAQDIYHTTYDKAAFDVKPEIQEILKNTSKKESKETTDTWLTKYILDSNQQRVQKLKTTWMLDIDGGEIQTNLSVTDKKNIPILESKDIVIGGIGERESNKEKYHIQKLAIRNEPMTAIQIPQYILNMPLQDTYLGKKLLAFKDKDRYPALLHKKEWKKLKEIMDKKYLIRQIDQAKDSNGAIKTTIKAQSSDSNQEDILKNIAKQGMEMQSIRDCIVLTEMIFQKFWEEYVDQSFVGNKVDDTKLEEIQKEFLIHFNNKTSDGYLIRDYSIYRQVKPYQKDGKEEYNAGFLRGYFTSDNGALGGVCSLSLNWFLDFTDSGCGFRALE